MRYPKNVIIDPRKVLPSRHTIFIRGFPASVHIEDVKNLFSRESNGNCRIDFFSYSEDKNSLFLAVRFESHSVAKELISKYDGEKVLGHKVEVTWFKDIRKARKKVIENEYKYHRLLAQPNFESWRRPYGRFPPRRQQSRRFPPYNSDRYYDYSSRKRRISASRSLSSSSRSSYNSRSRSPDRHPRSSSGTERSRKSTVSSKKYPKSYTRSTWRGSSYSSSSPSSSSASSRKSSPSMRAFQPSSGPAYDNGAILHLPFESCSYRDDSNESRERSSTQLPVDFCEQPIPKHFSPSIRESTTDHKLTDIENDSQKSERVSKTKRSKRKKHSHKYRRNKHKCKNSTNRDQEELMQQYEHVPTKSHDFYELESHSSIPMSVRSNDPLELQTDMDETKASEEDAPQYRGEEVTKNTWEDRSDASAKNVDESKEFPSSDIVPLNSIFLPEDTCDVNPDVFEDTLAKINEARQQLVSTTYDTDSAKDEKEGMIIEPKGFEQHNEDNQPIQLQPGKCAYKGRSKKSTSSLGEVRSFRPFGVRTRTLLPTPVLFEAAQPLQTTTVDTHITHTNTTTTEINCSIATIAPAYPTITTTDTTVTPTDTNIFPAYTTITTTDTTVTPTDTNIFPAYTTITTTDTTVTATDTNIFPAYTTITTTDTTDTTITSYATTITSSAATSDMVVDSIRMDVSAKPSKVAIDVSTQVSTSTVNAEGYPDGCIRLSILSDKQIDDVFQKKRLVEALYRVDCENLTKAVGQLIKLNPDLKDRLTASLKNILEERAKRSVAELQDYIKDQCA